MHRFIAAVRGWTKWNLALALGLGLGFAAADPAAPAAAGSAESLENCVTLPATASAEASEKNPRVCQPRIYVANKIDDTVSVVDPARSAVVATVPVGVNPFGVAVSPTEPRVYVANCACQPPISRDTAQAGTVSVIDTTSNQVIATVPVGKVPAALAVTHDGRRVYVANGFSDSISVIDTASNTVVKTLSTLVPSGSISTPAGVGVNPVRPEAYVTNVVFSVGHFLYVIDTTTDSIVDFVTLPLGPGLGIAVSPDGLLAYVNQFTTDVTVGTSFITVVDLTRRAVVRTISLPRNSGDFNFLALSPDGSRLYVTDAATASLSVIDTTDGLLRDIFLGSASDPIGVAVNPTGSLVYVSVSAGLLTIDAATFAIEGRVPLGAGPTGVAIAEVPAFVPPGQRR